MQVISLAPPCPSKHASASIFSTNDLVSHIYLTFFYFYFEMHEILCLKSCLFEKAKLIKHMLNSLLTQVCVFLMMILVSV